VGNRPTSEEIEQVKGHHSDENRMIGRLLGSGFSIRP
jgi:hypothetical protein